MPARSLSVLLVEDDPSWSYLGRHALPASWRVETCTTLQSALETLRGAAFDVVVLGLSLPDAQHDEGLKTLGGQFPSVPVVVLTSHESAEIQIGAFQHTAHELIGKGDTQARLAAIVESSDDAIIGGTLDGIITSWNRAAERMYGYSAPEALGRSMTTLAPDDRPDEIPGILGRLRSGERAAQIETEHVRRDGSRFAVSVSVSPIRDQADRTTGASVIARDVTERRAAENALRRSAERLRAVLDAALDAVVGMDAQGRVTALNSRAELLFGWSAAEAIGRKVADLMIPERDREAHARGLARFLATGHGGFVGRGAETTVRRRDGSEFSVEMSVVAMEDEGTLAFTAFLADISERKATESRLRERDDQLRQSQKIESIGRLAGGVAHDFNNILGAITGYAELLRRKLADGSREARYADDLLKAAQRAAGLTRQLLAFSRRQVLAPRIIDLNVVVQEMESMLRRLIGEDVHLLTIFDEHIPPVKADPGQLEQVIMNLAVNARDAMPSGGRLLIETARLSLLSDQVSLHATVPEGEYATLSFTDTGHGMSPDVLAHIFEPFFTTKEQGRGTGLGLAMVHGIVEQSGGHIGVESRHGVGTTFRIYLPLPTVGEPSGLDPGTGDREDVPTGSETILVSEDEQGLREVLKDALMSFGYTTLTAANGPAALEVSDRETGRIDLLITDVVMPGMGGRDLAEKLRVRRPEIKVLYVSGYTDDAVLMHGPASRGTAFLEKPFRMGALARKVREVLDGAEP